MTGGCLGHCCVAECLLWPMTKTRKMIHGPSCRVLATTVATIYSANAEDCDIPVVVVAWVRCLEAELRAGMIYRHWLRSSELVVVVVVVASLSSWPDVHSPNWPRTEHPSRLRAPTRDWHPPPCRDNDEGRLPHCSCTRNWRAAHLIGDGHCLRSNIDCSCSRRRWRLGSPFWSTFTRFYRTGTAPWDVSINCPHCCWFFSVCGSHRNCSLKKFACRNWPSFGLHKLKPARICLRSWAKWTTEWIRIRRIRSSVIGIPYRRSEVGKEEEAQQTTTRNLNIAGVKWPRWLIQRKRRDVQWSHWNHSKLLERPHETCDEGKASTWLHLWRTLLQIFRVLAMDLLFFIDGWLNWMEILPETPPLLR